MNERYEDINALARHAYGLGITPIDYAEHAVTTLVEVHLMVWGARTENPAAFPGYCIEMSIGAAARRIIGDLLDAGWTPPEVPDIATGGTPS